MGFMHQACCACTQPDPNDGSRFGAPSTRRNGETTAGIACDMAATVHSRTQDVHACVTPPAMSNAPPATCSLPVTCTRAHVSGRFSRASSSQSTTSRPHAHARGSGLSNLSVSARTVVPGVSPACLPMTSLLSASTLTPFGTKAPYSNVLLSSSYVNRDGRRTQGVELLGARYFIASLPRPLLLPVHLHTGHGLGGLLRRLCLSGLLHCLCLSRLLHCLCI